MARYDTGLTYDSGVRYDEPEENNPASSTMIQLNRFAKNPFDSPEVSIDELCAGATETLQRMVANNPGFLTTKITTLTAALANCDTAVTNDTVKLGLRKGRKLAKDTFRNTLPEAITKIHAAVVAKYGPNAPEVLDCFPHGRSVFQVCRDDRLENELNTTSAAITAKVAALGAPLVAEIGALVSTWTALYAASELSSGEKKATGLTQKAVKQALATELFKVLLTVALEYPGEPAKIDAYFQQSLFENPGSEEEEEPEPPPPGP